MENHFGVFTHLAFIYFLNDLTLKSLKRALLNERVFVTTRVLRTRKT